jgi:ribonucleoside-diphosphate reductase beta chain
MSEENSSNISQWQPRSKKKPRIKTPKKAYLFDYPEADEFAKQQNSVFWTADEIKVEKDKQDIMVNMTEAERHGVITTLKLFTKYELIVGNEYWSTVVAKKFPRPEIEKMASCFAFFELNVHAPFYAKINETLGLATEEFYTSYVNDPVLNDRMEFIDSVLSSKDDLLALAGFSMIEGAVLYSSFAYLKHFQSQGKNKLMNVVRGINFSVRDENLHAEAGAWLFRTLKSELQLSTEEIMQLEEKVKGIAETIRTHEHRIVDMIFEKGEVDGITDTQMKHFVDSRINLCLENLGFKKIYEVTYNPVKKWFYSGINNFSYNDFFSGVGNSYNRDWSESEFTWKGNQ